MAIPYPLLCALLGFVYAWFPLLVHGPIPYKLDTVRLNGDIAVWAYYTARLLIGVMVGLTRWPPQGFWRGPLCGLLMMLPVGLVALATPGCGWG